MKKSKNPEGESLTREQVIELRKQYNKKSVAYRKSNATQEVVLKREPPNRGINDPAEVARRVAIVRQAKYDHMVKHGELRLSSKVLRGLRLDGERA